MWRREASKSPWIWERAIPFGQFLYMAKYPSVDAVDEEIRPCLPIVRRPHVVAVPSGSHEAGSPAGQRDEAKLASLALEMPVQMRRMDVVGREFLHRGRLLDYVESKDSGFVPDCDGFHEGSGGEDAPADRAHSLSLNFCVRRASHPGLEQPILGRR